MKKKLIKKYILLSLPFFVGGGLYWLGIFNIFSSLLFFVGGYVVLKNVFDYRLIKKNINKINNIEIKKVIDNQFNNSNICNNDRVNLISRNREEKIKKYKSCEDIPLLKSNRSLVKIRRRY